MACNGSFTKPLTQLDINTWLLGCLQVKLVNMLLWFKTFAGHIFPEFEHASRGLWHGFHSLAFDALSFFKNTCRHRALNPLSVPRCVRCAVERRCWRISRNAILQGGKRGVIWGQRGGNVWTVKHFTFLEAESEHFYPSRERGRSEGDWWNDSEKWWQSADLYHR